MKKLHYLNALLFNTQHGPLSRLPRDLWEGGQPGDASPPENQGDMRLSRAEWEAKRRSELAEKSHADLAAKVAQLEADNRALRGRAAKDGEVVLTVDQAKAWAAYVAIGKPEEITSRLKDGDAARVENTTLRREANLSALASDMKWKPSALSKLAKDVEIVVKDGADGKKVYSVKEGDKEIPLEQYAKANWEEFLPSLQATGSTGGTGSNQGAGNAGQGAGIGANNQGAGNVQFPFGNTGSNTPANPIDSRLGQLQEAAKTNNTPLV